MQTAGFRAPEISFLGAALALLTACAASRPDIIQVGPWFAPKSPEQVEVFSSRNETRQPWGAIAIIHSARFPAGIGADGLIVVEETVNQEPGLGNYQEPEVFVSALAFKYAANVSTPAAPAAK